MRALYFYFGFAAALLSTAALAQTMPDPARLKADDEKLVSFGTRHSASDVNDPKRGIGAARRWFQAQLDTISKQCGNCIQTSTIARDFVVPRVPNGINIVDVLGIQPGEDPNRVVIIQGHIDSRVTNEYNNTSDAPGANDDGSGTVLVLEAARILSKEKFKATIIYAALSGEEQGLLGGKLIADTAKERGWKVSAVLNNDIVGNTVGTDGTRVADKVRLFSEGIEMAAPIDAQLALRASGGENDTPSRALAKRIRAVARTIPGGLQVVAINRPDRFGRSGDHTPFLQDGFPAAVRFTVGVENFAAQHQDLRPGFGDTLDKMDFPYLAKVTAINIATARSIAAAPAAPETVALASAVADPSQPAFGQALIGTTVTWTPVSGASGYRIYWRSADSAGDWTGHTDIAGATTSEGVVKGVIVDDNFLGVAAVGPNGDESLITFGGLAVRRRPPAQTAAPAPAP
jgi:hypothetical protein